MNERQAIWQHFNEIFNQPLQDAIREMKKLTPEQRVAVMDCFCRYCGSDNPNCHCANDE